MRLWHDATVGLWEMPRRAVYAWACCIVHLLTIKNYVWHFIDNGFLTQSFCHHRRYILSKYVCVVWYGMLRYGMVWYGMAHHSTPWRGMGSKVQVRQGKAKALCYVSLCYGCKHCVLSGSFPCLWESRGPFLANSLYFIACHCFLFDTEGQTVCLRKSLPLEYPAFIKTKAFSILPPSSNHHVSLITRSVSSLASGTPMFKQRYQDASFLCLFVCLPAICASSLPTTISVFTWLCTDAYSIIDIGWYRYFPFPSLFPSLHLLFFFHLFPYGMFLWPRSSTWNLLELFGAIWSY